MWELSINNSFYYRSDSFFPSPVMEIDELSLVSRKNMNSKPNLTVWNSFRNRIPEDAHIRIYTGDSVTIRT